MVSIDKQNKHYYKKNAKTFKMAENVQEKAILIIYHGKS
jgi:hypothetical protein